MKRTRLTLLIVITILNLSVLVSAEEEANLSIYEIQYTTDPNGNSNYVGEIVDCSGGIVIHKYEGYYPKVFLYDNVHHEGWGGIVVRDYTAAAGFDDVNIGDWVSLTHTLVEEFRGNTQLNFESGSGFEVTSSDNPLPAPIVVSPADIAAPVYQQDPNRWRVADHNAEKYEAMWIKVKDVNVGDMDIGKAYDNYVLYNPNSPNDSNCWASDYINEDLGPWDDYHPYVTPGQHFCSVKGILEQYTGEKHNIDWDYYQLLTTTTEDFTISQACDLDEDCDVDFLDFSLFAQHWLEEGCTEPDWCGGADLTKDEPNGIVNILDLKVFSEHWLEGKY